MLSKTFRNLATITRNVTEADVTLSIMLDAKYVYITPYSILLNQTTNGDN